METKAIETQVLHQQKLAKIRQDVKAAAAIKDAGNELMVEEQKVIAPPKPVLPKLGDFSGLNSILDSI